MTKKLFYAAPSDSKKDNSKQDPRLLEEVGDLSVYLTYYQKRCKLSIRPIKIVPIKQTGCHVVLRQRMEERARIKLARSHSDKVVFK